MANGIQWCTIPIKRIAGYLETTHCSSELYRGHIFKSKTTTMKLLLVSFLNLYIGYPNKSKCIYSSLATVILLPISKRGVSKRGIFKSNVSYVLNFKSWIKLIYDKITYTYCVTNEFNPTFEIQNMGNEAFKNASFVNASFGNGNEDNS